MIVAAIVLLPILAFIAIKVCWKVAAPSQAGIVSGWRVKGSSGSADGADALKVFTGGGAFVVPGLQRFETLSLAQHKAELRVDAVDKKKISTGTQGVVLFKINDDPISVTNAARRFLEGGQSLDSNVKDVFEGHLRAIIGGMTIVELIEDRAALARKVREACDEEMQNMGLKIDSFQIKEILDPSGYIAALGAPQTAQVKMEARVAEAQRNREAEHAEQEAAALEAEARRNSEIKQADLQAEVDEARAKSAQAGPLAEAEARKAVVEQETEVARLKAAQTEQELMSTVVKTADAEAYAQRTRANAERDAAIARAEAQAAEREKVGEAEARATKATGEAEADVIRAKGDAEATSLKLRAEALAANQDAVIQQQIAEQLPQIIEAAAKPFESIGNLTVLNGAEGLTDMVNQIMAQGVTAIGVGKQLMSASTDAKEAAAVQVLPTASKNADTADNDSAAV